MEIKLNAKAFSNFLRCLSLLKYNSAAIDIKEGVLRQRTNGKTSIFQMDLSPLISTLDICMDNLKRKLPLLNRLSKQQVKITPMNNKISFEGQRSSYRFITPRVDHSDNEFITAQGFADLCNLREQDLLLECVLKRDMSKLMKVTFNQFSGQCFEVLFLGNIASITATDMFGGETSTMKYGIPIKRPSKGVLSIVTTPFLIDHDGDLLFQMYEIRENVYVAKFTTSIGKITINVYCKSQLREQE